MSDDGPQRIQTIENYLTDNDDDEVEFEFSFDTIAEELDLETNGVSIASVKYFEEDYIVLHFNYKGKPIRKAGATNVMIDLQDKEDPIAYLIDLGWD